MAKMVFAQRAEIMLHYLQQYGMRLYS